MGAGRPTLYNKGILIKSRRYMNARRPGWLTDVREVIPSIEGLAYYLGVDRDTIYDWQKDPAKKEFSDIVKSLLTKQGMTLINGGLSEKFSGKISGLLLSKHGYKEKVDVTTDDKPIGENPEREGLVNDALRTYINGKRSGGKDIVVGE